MNEGGKKTIKMLSLAVLGMFFFSFALVPLYDVFCEVTGLNGKIDLSPSRIVESDISEGRDITVQFVSHNNEQMPWDFGPSDEVINITTGKYYTATYYVKNTTSKAMVAQAIPSVAPSNAAAHLKKLECFCFEQQILKPGEEAPSFGATLFFWFRKVVQEHLAGLDSAQLNQSFVYGMAWFIFSEVMFFAAFFGALFYVRTFSVPWLGGEGEKGLANMLWENFQSTWPLLTTPDLGAAYTVPEKSMSFPGWDKILTWLPLWNTIVLLSSSVTVHMAHINLKAANKNKFNIWLGVTVSLAIFFVFLQALEYYEAYEHYGLTLNSGIYGSTFFMLTGFHGFHVMMGGLMLSVMLIRSVFYNHFKPDPHEHFGFEAASWYWHFVDVVWVMLFMFVYIL